MMDSGARRILADCTNISGQSLGAITSSAKLQSSLRRESVSCPRAISSCSDAEHTTLSYLNQPPPQSTQLISLAGDAIGPPSSGNTDNQQLVDVCSDSAGDMRPPRHDLSLLQGDSQCGVSFSGGAPHLPSRRRRGGIRGAHHSYSSSSLSAVAGRSFNSSGSLTCVRRTVPRAATKGVLTIDAQTTQIVTCNTACAEMLGYSPEHLCRLTLGQLLLTSQQTGRSHAGNSPTSSPLHERRGGVAAYCGDVVEVRCGSGVAMPVSLWLQSINENTTTHVASSADIDGASINTASIQQRCVAVIEPVKRVSARFDCSASGRVIGASRSVDLVFGGSDVTGLGGGALERGAVKGAHINTLLPALQLHATTSRHVTQRKQNICARRLDGTCCPVSVYLATLNDNTDKSGNIHVDAASGYHTDLSSPAFSVHVHMYPSLTGLVVLDQQLVIHDCNSTFVSLALGLCKLKLIGQSIHTLIPTFDEDMNMMDCSSADDPADLERLMEMASFCDDSEYLAALRSSSSPARSSTSSPAATSASVVPGSGADSTDRCVEDIAPDQHAGSNIGCNVVAAQSNTVQTMPCSSTSPRAGDRHMDGGLCERYASRPAGQDDVGQCSRVASCLHRCPSNSSVKYSTDGDASSCVLGAAACSTPAASAPPLTSTPGSSSTGRARASTHADVRRLTEETYYGEARHADGSRFNVTYDVRVVETDTGAVFYCLWISADCLQPQIHQQQQHNFTTGSACNVSQQTGAAHQIADAVQHCCNILPTTITTNNNCHSRLTSSVASSVTPVMGGEFQRYYTSVRQIGNGAFGTVKLCYRNGDRLMVVTKFIRKSRVSRASWVDDPVLARRVPLEVSLLCMLRHQNIVSVLDVFENERFTQLVMERHGCMDLFEFIERRPTLDEPLISYLFRQVCSAVSYLHRLEIVHGDVKDENVIVDERFCVKLIDFGSAAFVARGTLLTSFSGTLEYCAPEVLAGHKYDGYATEMWSLGVTLYTLTCGENPFCDVTGTVTRSLRLPVDASSLLKEVLSGLLHKQPDARMTMNTALQHSWIFQPVDIGSYHFADVVACGENEMRPARYMTNSQLSRVDVSCERDGVGSVCVGDGTSNCGDGDDQGRCLFQYGGTRRSHSCQRDSNAAATHCHTAHRLCCSAGQDQAGKMWASRALHARVRSDETHFREAALLHDDSLCLHQSLLQ